MAWNSNKNTLTHNNAEGTSKTDLLSGNTS